MPVFKNFLRNQKSSKFPFWLFTKFYSYANGCSSGFFCCSVGTLLQRFFLFTYLCNFSQIIYNVCAFHLFSFFAMYSRTKKLKKIFFLDMELFFSFSKKNLSICHSKSVYPWKSWMILQKTEVMLCVCFVFLGNWIVCFVFLLDE